MELELQGIAYICKTFANVACYFKLTLNSEHDYLHFISISKTAIVRDSRSMRKSCRPNQERHAMQRSNLSIPVLHVEMVTSPNLPIW